jgi:ribosomal protein L31
MHIEPLFSFFIKHGIEGHIVHQQVAEIMGPCHPFFAPGLEHKQHDENDKQQRKKDLQRRYHKRVKLSDDRVIWQFGDLEMSS